MIAVIDYGMGNLRSVQKAIERVEGKAIVTDSPEKIATADKIVLPGVGAMKPAIDKLKKLHLVEVIEEAINKKKPFLGICLGFQLLFEKSQEGGENVFGLGLLKGTVERFTNLKVPHMGWNQINIKTPECPIFKDIENNSDVYFCHSYYVNPQSADIKATTTDYGIEFTSSVWKGNIFGVQFHPEKSQALGLKILNNFIRM